MAFLLPKMQAPKAPSAPRYTDAEITEAAAEQRKRLYGEAGGRRSTMGGGLDAMTGIRPVGGDVTARSAAPGYATASSRLLGSAG